MRHITILTTALALALAGTAHGQAKPAATSPDCSFDGAKTYNHFGAARLFTTGGDLYACLTDVGRSYRLNTGTLTTRSSTTRRLVFGLGDWIAFPSRTRSGDVRVNALNIRSGRAHGAKSSTTTALVVNRDGTLAWIAGNEVRAKRLGQNGTTRLGSSASIDRRFLGIELEGCAVTWKAAGVQRSSSIYCRNP